MFNLHPRRRPRDLCSASVKDQPTFPQQFFFPTAVVVVALSDALSTRAHYSGAVVVALSSALSPRAHYSGVVVVALSGALSLHMPITQVLSL